VTQSAAITALLNAESKEMFQVHHLVIPDGERSEPIRDP
jgi:hypothetical protein